ncbi:hypothetical protein BU197_13630 [Streptomyces sp. CBMA291]|nr:hypothetical protein [Streptomyces sp. CBMA291]MBD0713858.1 hypothetical protein [Streptomyces sp. CBMA370]
MLHVSAELTTRQLSCGGSGSRATRPEARPHGLDGAFTDPADGLAGLPYSPASGPGKADLMLTHPLRTRQTVQG